MNMINRLFRSFDPIGRILSLNYIVLACVFLTPIFITFFFKQTRSLKLITENILTKIEEELRSSINNQNKKGKIILLLGLFIFVLLLNIIGLIPYVFTITAHISFTFSLALPLWLGFVIFRLRKNTNHFLRHLVPLRTPLPLSQFIVLIETVSQIIRPLTLSVRLAANITAGHILIALTRRTITVLNIFSFVLLVLIGLEIAVAIIQRYVFTVLITIYLRETYDKTTSPFSYGPPKTLTFYNRSSHDIYIGGNCLLNLHIKHIVGMLKNNTNSLMLLAMMTRCFSRGLFPRISHKFSYKWIAMRDDSIYYIWNFIFFFLFFELFSTEV